MKALFLSALLATAPDPSAPTLTQPAPVVDHGTPMAVGPLQIGVSDGDAGLVRRALPRTELSVGVRPGAIVDTPGFYGNIGAGLEVAGSYQVSPRTEVFGSVTALQFRFLQNATLQRTHLTLGQSSFGATHIAVQNEAYTLSPFFRVHLPTSFENTNVHPFGLEPGVSATGLITSTVAWHAGATLPFLLSDSVATGTHPFLQFGAVGGAQWLPSRVFSLVAELGTRFDLVNSCPTGNSCLGPPQAFNALTAGLGFRFAFGDAAGLELDAVAPLAGANRTTVAANLRGSWRF